MRLGEVSCSGFVYVCHGASRYRHTLRRDVQRAVRPFADNPHGADFISQHPFDRHDLRCVVRVESKAHQLTSHFRGDEQIALEDRHQIAAIESGRRRTGACRQRVRRAQRGTALPGVLDNGAQAAGIGADAIDNPQRSSRAAASRAPAVEDARGNRLGSIRAGRRGSSRPC